jgi:hypothetical protein
MHTEVKDSMQVLVCIVGKTVLSCDASCIEGLHWMLKARGDWMKWRR